jgi:hypothetical protein
MQAKSVLTDSAVSSVIVTPEDETPPIGLYQKLEIGSVLPTGDSIPIALRIAVASIAASYCQNEPK